MFLFGRETHNPYGKFLSLFASHLHPSLVLFPSFLISCPAASQGDGAAFAKLVLRSPPARAGVGILCLLSPFILVLLALSFRTQEWVRSLTKPDHHRWARLLNSRASETTSGRTSLCFIQRQFPRYQWGRGGIITEVVKHGIVHKLYTS